MIDLLPCPFCGGPAVNHSHRSCDCCGKAFTGIVTCTKCEAEVSHLDTSEEAERLWNTRAALSQPAPAGREAIAKILTKYFWTGEPGEHGAIKEATEVLLSLPPHDGGADAPDDDDNTMREDPMFNRGVQHVVDLLAKTLEPLGDWYSGDGSEDYDSDLEETLRNILAAKGLLDKETGEFATPPAPVADRAAVIEECIDIARKYDDCGASFIIERLQELALAVTRADRGAGS
jgi:hypothetical protein